MGLFKRKQGQEKTVDFLGESIPKHFIEDLSRWERHYEERGKIVLFEGFSRHFRDSPPYITYPLPFLIAVDQVKYGEDTLDGIIACPCNEMSYRIEGRVNEKEVDLVTTENLNPLAVFGHGEQGLELNLLDSKSLRIMLRDLGVPQEVLAYNGEHYWGSLLRKEENRGGNLSFVEIPGVYEGRTYQKGQNSKWPYLGVFRMKKSPNLG